MEKKDVELQVQGHALIDGELYVATLKKKKKTKEAEKANVEGASVLLQESTSSVTMEHVRNALRNEGKVGHTDLVNAWAVAAKMIKQNSEKMRLHRQAILENTKVIRNLEAAIA